MSEEVMVGSIEKTEGAIYGMLKRFSEDIKIEKSRLIAIGKESEDLDLDTALRLSFQEGLLFLLQQTIEDSILVYKVRLGILKKHESEAT